MIIFKTLSWKNFLSTGNTPTEIDLTGAASTLITGKNGSGKSTFLDALTFALFGKPHRGINKPQLVNSINQKDCLVEITFEIGVAKFKIIRGINPGVFQIYENGRLIPQPSTVKDYQRFLEQNILKINYKTFNQVVVLGSSSFVPFMQLSTGNRRQIVEDLLDINVFTAMNKLLRESNSKTKEKYKDVEYKIKLEENKQKTQQKYIANLETLNEDMISDKNKAIEDNKAKGVAAQKKATALKTKIEEGDKILTARTETLNRKRGNLTGQISHLASELSSLNKQEKFFENNDSCPSCTQDIEDSLKEKMQSTLTGKTEIVIEHMDDFKAELAELDGDLKQLADISELIKADRKKKDELNSELKSLFKLIQQLQADIIKIQQKSADVDKAKTELRKIEDDITHFRNKRGETAEDLEYNAVMAEMLKDSGIKTKIIKQYIEPLNQIINNYLQVLDFFVLFNLDENFNEQIKSRHRDVFTYSSFSEGEKQRIDLSVLFAFRQIAKMKNSVDTNLLILDETFDSSLDVDGVDNLLTILDTLDAQTNVFVISHKGHMLAEKFESGLTFEKQNNFSQMRKN